MKLHQIVKLHQIALMGVCSLVAFAASGAVVPVHHLSITEQDEKLTATYDGNSLQVVQLAGSEEWVITMPSSFGTWFSASFVGEPETPLTAYNRLTGNPADMDSSGAYRSFLFDSDVSGNATAVLGNPYTFSTFIPEVGNGGYYNFNTSDGSYFDIAMTDLGVTAVPEPSNFIAGALLLIPFLIPFGLNCVRRLPVWQERKNITALPQG